MTRPNNPRFPHRCRIIRYAATEPMEDQANVYDQTDDDPMADDLALDEPIEDSLNDGGSTDNADQEEGDTEKTNLPDGATVIYEGVCRSDNRDTISDNGDVIASYRTLALPLKQDEWTEETVPHEGDKIELQRFGYKEYGLVIDLRPSNLGTHLLWKYVRN